MLFKPSDPVKPGTHPCALEFSPDGKTLYVALANRDSVAAVDVSGTGATAKFELKGYFDTRLPGQSYFGAEPVALALSGDGGRLYVANMGSDAVAAIDTRKLTASAAKQGMVEPEGFIPTEWMPMSMAVVHPTHGDKTAMMAPGRSRREAVCGDGEGAGHRAEQLCAEAGARRARQGSRFHLHCDAAAWIAGGGRLSAVDLKAATAEVMESNRMKAAEEKIAFAGGKDPIKHVIYIIKENRTYDQIFGDLKQNGKPVGNGDASLAMYGESVTPNQHELALRFGVLDNFFDSGEVSGDGHVWSNAAIGTDYLEKNWQIQYRNSQRTYDYEGDGVVGVSAAAEDSGCE